MTVGGEQARLDERREVNVVAAGTERDDAGVSEFCRIVQLWRLAIVEVVARAIGESSTGGWTVWPYRGSRGSTAGEEGQLHGRQLQGGLGLHPTLHEFGVGLGGPVTAIGGGRGVVGRPVVVHPPLVEIALTRGERVAEGNVGGGGRGGNLE